jgi:transposase
MKTTTRDTECIANPTTLFVALELGDQRWKLASSVGMGVSPRRKSVTACSAFELENELAAAKRRFGLPADAPVVSCHEAGRDGFAPHRLLVMLGVRNYVVDPSSIEVNRRSRQAKTDRLDAAALLRLLLAYEQGDRFRWRLVHVPSVEVEDARQVHRELDAARADVTRVGNRITSLVVTQGARVELTGRIPLPTQLERLRLPDGRVLAPALHARLLREWALLEHLRARVAALEESRHEAIVTVADDLALGKVRRLMEFKGVGEGGASVLVHDCFWRDFRNRRQVGASAGLTPTPYDSGESTREQGISKAGNPRVRKTMVQLAWMWVRHQPRSALTRWFEERFGSSKRHRRIGIVALARRLLIAFWRYLTTGDVPVGAVLKRPVRIAA